MTTDPDELAKVLALLKRRDVFLVLTEPVAEKMLAAIRAERECLLARRVSLEKRLALLEGGHEH